MAREIRINVVTMLTLKHVMNRTDGDGHI